MHHIKNNVTKNVTRVAALSLIIVLAGQTPASAVPVLTVGGFTAGADTYLSTAPALDSAKTSETAPSVIKVDTGAQDDTDSAGGEEGSVGGEEGSASPVSFTAGAASLVTATAVVAPEDMDTQEFEEEEAAGAAYGYTNLGIAQVEDHLNVREGADKGSKIVGKMENDTGCEVLGIEGEMAHITSGSVEGYVSTEYLLMGDEAVAYADTIVKELATVTADGLKMREQPSLDAPVYDMVSYGEELEVFQTLSEWIGIEYDGKQLYVAKEYVSVDRKLKTALNMTEFLYGEGVSDVRVELCEYAKQFIGNPYVWGGTSLTKGADCSGFVLSVYAKFGISLPHSSRAQANCGTRIKVSEMKPGDLVFYAKGKRINHVGIYIGGGQIVNASSPKTGIRISSTYYRTPVAAVRILQD